LGLTIAARARYRWLDRAVTMAICLGWLLIAMAALTAAIAAVTYLRTGR
jgi:hypothetical protein